MLSIKLDESDGHVWLGRRPHLSGQARSGVAHFAGPHGRRRPGLCSRRKCVFMGDLGWSRTLPNLVDATVNDWIPTLDKVLTQYPTAKFVPGHGNVAENSEIKDFEIILMICARE